MSSRSTPPSNWTQRPELLVGLTAEGEIRQLLSFPFPFKRTLASS